MAGSTGLEPAASAVTGRRSSQLNYDPELTCCLKIEVQSSNLQWYGRYRIRTCDTRRVKPMLYH